MSTYADKLRTALESRLGAGFEVHVDSGLVVIRAGSATALTMPPRADRRGPVTPEQVDFTILAAASRLARDIPKFRPEFVEPSRALVGALRGAVGA